MGGPVLLTGGTGFLGSHIAERLVAAGVEVRALVRPTSDVRHLSSLPGVTLVRGSLGDPPSLAAAVRGSGSVIHAAALIKARRARDFEETNVHGTQALLQAAAAAGPAVARFVHVSSLAAMGPSRDGRPRGQDATPAPVTAYGQSKLAGEELVRAASGALHTVVIRPPVVYGPRDREVLAFFQAVKWGILPLTGSPDSVLSMVYAADCAEACVRALEANVPSGAAFDVEDGSPETLAGIIGHIEAALGTRVRIRAPIPGPALYLAALATEAVGWVTRRPVMLTRDKLRELRAPHWVCDSAPARSALGWTPRVTLTDGARLSAAWYRNAGWL
jgi:nucleoside-diphosphate-sugar epimerase